MHQLLLKYYNSKPKLHSSKKSVKVDTDAKVDIIEPFSSTRDVVVVVVVVGDMPAPFWPRQDLSACLLQTFFR